MPECFYTLPKRIEDRRVVWRIEEQLRSHIELLSEQFNSLDVCNSETLESQIACYLFKQLRQHPEKLLLQKHWRSFLFRRCEKVAIAILRLIPNSSYSCFLPDLFNMGFEVINDPLKFFRSFDENHSNFNGKQNSNSNYWYLYPKLKTFSDNKIKFCLFPKVRELTGFTTIGLTNLGLTSRSSRKQVIEALKQSQSPEIASQYLQAWQGLQEVKKSIKVKLNKFQPEHFQLIADRYNQLAPSQTRQIDRETICDWLEEIGRAIRRFLEPQSISLDCQFEEGTTLIDILPSNQNLDEDLLSQWEINQTRIALRQFIASWLSEIENFENRQILLLRYGFNLNQSRIAEELQRNQSTIHHHLNSLHQNILGQIGEWVRQNIGIEPTSEGLNEIKNILIQYYSDQIDRLTIDAIKLLEERRQNLLTLFYVVGLTTAKITEQIEISETQLEEFLKASEQELYHNITKQIEAEIQLQFRSLAVQERIRAQIKSKLPTVLQQLDKN
jgi:DNA-directed RNA polymerase specialized sigma24 family protein